MTELLIKTLKRSCWYQLYDNSDKDDFCTWVMVGMVLGLALILVWCIL